MAFLCGRCEVKKLILALALLAGCEYECGAMVPVTYDRNGVNTSLFGKDCRGSWQALSTGPWYRCECGEVKP